MSHDEAIAELKAVVAANGSQKETARAFCVSPQYLNDILHGRREISSEVAECLGMRRVVSYEPLVPQPVLDLPLSVRLKNALIAHGALTFEQAAQVKYRDLAKGRGVGVVCILELDRYLRQRGRQPLEAIPKWILREARAREKRRIAKDSAAQRPDVHDGGQG